MAAAMQIGFPDQVNNPAPSAIELANGAAAPAPKVVAVAPPNPVKKYAPLLIGVGIAFLLFSKKTRRRTRRR